MLVSMLREGFINRLFHWRPWGPAHRSEALAPKAAAPASDSTPPSSFHVEHVWGHSLSASLWFWRVQTGDFLWDRLVPYIISNIPTTDVTQGLLLSPFPSSGNWSRGRNLLPGNTARKWQNPGSARPELDFLTTEMRHCGVSLFISMCCSSA